MSIVLDKASLSYGSTPALHDISLKINAGEQVALIGPSGCGKTSLLKLIGTQLEPTAGNISILDKQPELITSRQLHQLRTSIAFIPQHLGLVPNVRVLRNVLNGKLSETTFINTIRQLFWVTRIEQEKVFQILERTGIGEKIYDRTDSLSGGQQQRVAVARALYQKPLILLADEPVSSIDPARARDMIELLTNLSSEDNVTLVISLHNLELAREFFPRLIGLRHGKIAFDRAPDDLNDRECTSLYQLQD